MPMELSMPLGVSATRGVGLPARLLGDTLLITSAPRLLKSSASEYSMAKQPDAGMTGLRSCRSPTLTLSLAKLHLPDDVAYRKNRPFAADAQELLIAPLGVEQAHTGQADAHSTGHALLHRHLPEHIGKVFKHPLQQHQKTMRTTGINGIVPLLLEQAAHQHLDRVDVGRAVAVVDA